MPALLDLSQVNRSPLPAPPDHPAGRRAPLHPVELGPRGLPVAYWVRDVRVDPAVVLAPMEGVTDLVFRRLIRSIGGPGLTYTEFIASSAILAGRGKAWDMAQFDPDERPIALQIYGREPQVMAEAARMLQDLGATILDINMGCPSKKVCAHSGGSALMREPELAVSIVRAVRAAIDIPLTVKMRAGFDRDHLNASELCWRFQEEGVEALTIHWRTRQELYGGERDVEEIARAVDRVAIPVIGNGDVIDIPSARRMFEETGCAGVMVGRGAIRRPWVLRRIGRWLRGEELQPETADEREAVLNRYIETIHEAFDSEHGALGRTKMVVRHFAQDLPEGTHLRKRALPLPTREAVEDALTVYFDALRRFEAGDEDAIARWVAG